REEAGVTAVMWAPFLRLKLPLSPRGRGLRRLSEQSELSRSWVRGPRPQARSARALWSFASCDRANLPPPPARGRGMPLLVFLLISAFVVLCNAPASAVELTGHLTQGGLVMGHTVPGAKVMLGDRQVMVGPDGLFVFGFGRDQAPTAELAITTPDGAT